MCLIITLISALVSFVVYMHQSKTARPVKSLATLSLMYTAASIMWCCDGIANLIGGEPFLEISASDTILGIIIMASGLVAFAILFFMEKRKSTNV